LIAVTISIWLVATINWALDYNLNRFGLFPRKIDALIGILATPFLHGSWPHLVNNTFAFLTLGWLASLYDTKRRSQLATLSLFIIVIGGLLTWTLGRPYFHIGLSGVIFGYWGFITINGLFDRSIKSIFISFIALIFYGGMVFGILPNSPSISFESHVFGAISGILYSYIFYGRQNK
ncbi:MAG: membrane associated rhomboid family serine protease, partial [Cellvibrionaceae bacterium]